MAKARTIVSYIFRRRRDEPMLYPDYARGYVDDFLRMCFAVPYEPFESDPLYVHALGRLLIIHADHEQNCSTSVVRIAGSAHANLYSAVAAGVNALSGPLHGGANEAVLRQLKAIRDSGKSVAEFVRDAKENGQKISGLGHRVYKSYDPRAAIARKYLEKIMEREDTQKLPSDERALFAVATEREDIALNDEYYPEVVAGRIPNREITEDDLHPNDKGHELVASVITYALDKIRMAQTDDEEPEFPAPLTQNCYEKAVRLDNRNYEPENYGFVKDTRVQEEVKDCFKNGWAAKEKGSSLTFTVQGSEIAVQFKRCVTQPAPVALAIVDHDEAHAVTLDANFDEDWGDSLTLTPVMVHGANGTHTVEVRLISGDETMPAVFELISVITSEK